MSLFQTKSPENTKIHTSRQNKINNSEREESSLQEQNARDSLDTSYEQSGDRPLSFPSLRGLTDDPDLLQRLQALSLERQEVKTEIRAEVNLEKRSRSKSQDDFYYHDDQQSRYRGHRHHRKCTHRTSRRRRNTPRERSAHVDVSLDDNCPGLPQNRVTKRSRHHTYQHRSAGGALCDQCLQERLKCCKNSSPAMSKREKSYRPIHVATGEMAMTDGQDSSSPGSNSAGEGDTKMNPQRSVVMTLEDIKSVTSDFLKGTNDLDDTVIEDLKMQFLLGMEEQRKASAAAVATAGLSGRGSISQRMDAIQPCLSRNRPPHHKPIAPATNKRLRTPFWDQLVFPTEPRTGQDSPRTDMAVINLDLDGSAMRRRLHPTSLKDLSSATRDKQYIHHVIHHSQP